MGALLVAIIALPPSPAGTQTKTRLVVYSTLEADHIGKYKQAFEADNPDIELALVRDSTGIITSRLLAEKDNPRGDAIWGLAVTSMILLDEVNVLAPYAPRNLAEIKPNFRDPQTPPRWIGIDAWVGALCYNTVEAAKLKLPKPASWMDLLDPVYKGRIVMPNPASSGTGFFHVSMWLQSFGEDAGWRYMDRLNDNIAVYVHSGSKPCKMAASGEFPIGIAADNAGAVAAQQGAPIETLLMREGGGWDMDAAAIIRGTHNLAASQRLADWAASRKANELYATILPLVAISGIRSPIPHYTAGVEEAMAKNDLRWASANRARILGEWQKRYDAKSEPK
ncbi:MAG: putative 2-aminoethylphosphonate ABC transporter substrate-binding protein [Proteobacteria bacterium]|nr:putative 2-aminoethylphosphonate ABC transporter substrate-binding protein [Pseudomonadota bacterium]